MFRGKISYVKVILLESKNEIAHFVSRNFSDLQMSNCAMHMCLLICYFLFLTI